MAKANAKEKSTSTALHPPYFHMIADALSTLNERTRSSQQAIAKFIEDKHGKVLPPNFRTLLSVQLKKFVKSERLFKVKNSFKISHAEKLKLAVEKNKTAEHSNKSAKKVTEKGMKNKRLSHVKTPEVLKKVVKDAKKKLVTSSSGKVKRLSQVKTPEAMKKKKKTTSKPMNSSRPAKKARK